MYDRLKNSTENILCVDTATRGMSVSIFSGGACVVTRHHAQMRDQAAKLLPFVVDVLKDARLSFHDLEGLAVATGPGSFTGIRVGLSAMQGIALATGKPLAGFSNFDIYAQRAQMTGFSGMVVALESHRKEAFCQYYNADYMREGQPFQIVGDDLLDHVPHGHKPQEHNIIVTGNAVDFMTCAAQTKGFVVPEIPKDFAQEKSAQFLGKLFFKTLAEEKTVLEHSTTIPADTDAIAVLAQKNPAEPFYIRPPDVTISQKTVTA